MNDITRETKGQAKRKNSEWQEPVTSPTGHFTATPQSDVVRICAHDFQRHGDAFGTTENAFLRAFIILRSQFHLHHRSQRTLKEIVSKITPNLGLVL